MDIFVSHISEESLLAKTIKEWIETTFSGQFSVFVSSDADSIPPGKKWLDVIDAALERANALLVLCSPLSIARPWVNFEAGCAWIKRVPIIPLCHSGQVKGELPVPLSLFQAQDIEEDGFAEELIRALAEMGSISQIPKISFSEMEAQIRAAASKSQSDGPKESHVQSHAAISLDVEELKLLRIFENSGSEGWYFPDLVLEFGQSDMQTKYYLDKLTRDHELLSWIGSMIPDRPDRYVLTRKGRDFLVEHGYA